MKSKRKCPKCLGYGLWAVKGSHPVSKTSAGLLDARDSKMIKTCPKCGAHGKSVPKKRKSPASAITWAGDVQMLHTLAGCSTCWGYGLWATGNAAPMGRMDYIDGCPTKKCPECGAGGKTR